MWMTYACQPEAIIICSEQVPMRSRYAYSMVMKYLYYFASFRGRMGRGHFWLLVLAGTAMAVLAATIGSLNMGNEPVQWLAYVLLLASCGALASATFRRLHDLNFTSLQTGVFLVASGVLQTLALVLSRYSPTLGVIAVGVSIALFVALGAIKGAERPNKYAP